MQISAGISSTSNDVHLLIASQTNTSSHPLQLAKDVLVAETSTFWPWAAVCTAELVTSREAAADTSRV